VVVSLFTPLVDDGTLRIQSPHVCSLLGLPIYFSNALLYNISLWVNGSSNSLLQDEHTIHINKDAKIFHMIKVIKSHNEP
jgi:hypothetical protein